MTPVDHDLAAAYATDALEPQEVLAFERHLQDCPACREAVRQYRETLADLAAGLAVEPPVAVRANPRRRVRAWWSLAAAAVVLAAFAAGAFVGRQTAPVGTDGQLLAIASAPDVEVTPVDLMGTTGTVVTSQTRGETVFLASDLPMPPKKMCYQVWEVRADGSKVSAGLAVPDENGAVAVTLDTTNDVASYVITMEPPGGSPTPTGEMVGTSQA